MDEEPLDFLALGPLEVRRGERLLELGSRKQRAALGVLLLHAPHPVPVDRLVDELWPERPPGQPLRSVQVYVSGLRRALGPDAELVQTTGAAYRIALPPGRSDVDRFERTAARCLAAARRRDHEEVLRLADEALTAWRGRAWQDLQHLPGTGPAAARLEELRLDLLARRSAAGLALGRHADLVPDLEQLVAEHPLREDLREHLMEALHRCGRRQEALTAYAEGRRRLVEETGLEPGPGLRALHARILAEDPAPAPGPVVAPPQPARCHLPAPPTPLVGREREVAELGALLRGDCRLLTLRGPGGVGKTRVALQVAREAAAHFADGVWFVELAAVSDPALLPQVVADTLGLEEQAPDATAALVAHLAERHVLLVLDNLEQLADAAPFLARLVEAGPGVSLLTTSRVPLRVYGEHVRVLDVLDLDHAVPLFEDRARRVDQLVDLGRRDLVVELCTALDRLPLAIELVAARAHELTLLEMLARLGNPLDLAVDGPRDRPPRQQTLRGAVGWSLDLLPTSAARAFARASVFRGGASTDALAAVGVEEADVAPLVAASLASRSGDRLTMLETVREVGAELLAASGEEGAVRDAHAAYVVDLASRAAAGMRGPEAASWTRELTVNLPNVRAALARLEEQATTDHAAGERLLRLAADLSLYWYRACPASEDVTWLARALAAAPAAPALLRARAWHGLAICRGEQGRSEDALIASGRAIALFREAGDPQWLARALNTFGGLQRDLGRAEGAAVALQESLALRRDLRRPDLPVYPTLANLGLVAIDLQDLVSARDYLEECLRIAVRAGDDEDAAMAHSLLADVAVDAGRLDEARSHLRTAVAVLREHNRGFRLAECLDTLAALAARSGRPEAAARLAAAADRALTDDGGTQVLADARLRARRLGPALAALGPEEAARARAEGAALSVDDALDWAGGHLL